VRAHAGLAGRYHRRDYRMLGRLPERRPHTRRSQR